MYQIPGEVLRAEKPGVLGMSLYQLFGGMGGLYIASSLVEGHPVLYAVSVGIGIIVARRVRGMYLAQRVWNLLIWHLTNRFEGETVLAPDELYVSRRQAEVRSPEQHMLVVRRPDGAVYTVES